MRTLAQAARSESRKKHVAALTFSAALLTHYPASAKAKPIVGVYQHNLTTDTAVGYTNRRDWQSKAFADFGTTAFATNGVAATASNATTLTNSGAAFPTAGQGLAGKFVVVGPNASGTGSMVFGVIMSNTATALTVDQWYSVASTTAAAGVTPNATGFYIILPGQAPAPWMCVTSDATAPTSADTALASEATTNGFSRAIGTYAHTAAATTYTQTHLWTATGSLTVNNEAIGGAASAAAGGVMPFKSAEPTPPALLSGDTLTNTSTTTL